MASLPSPHSLPEPYWVTLTRANNELLNYSSTSHDVTKIPISFSTVIEIFSTRYRPCGTVKAMLSFYQKNKVFSCVAGSDIISK